MNKKTIAIISVIIILCGVAVGLWYNRQHSAKQPKTPSTNVSDAAKFKSEYPRVAANNRFVYASDKEILDIFDNGSGVVFLGFPQCPWCQHLSKHVDRAARAEGVDKIYYLNIRDARASNNEVYRKLVKKLEPYWKKIKMAILEYLCLMYRLSRTARLSVATKRNQLATIISRQINIGLMKE